MQVRDRIHSCRNQVNIATSGTGALTRHLANVMAEFPSVVIEFVVSDVSKELLPRIAYPRCRYKSFDLSRPVEDQGFELASFDVITGFHVLHVVANMAPSLAALRQLLVPGGSLLIGDLNGDSWTSRAPGSIWFDFIFGSFAEWFAFTDARSHCTMSIQEWRDCLHAERFGNVVTAEFSADPLLFTLEAQNLYQPDLAITRQTDHHDTLWVRYRREEEGRLRVKISACDASAPLSIWLFAGSGFNGDAGMGFSRSLGREFPLWNIHFVIFDGSWPEGTQIDLVSRLSCTTGLETLLLVDEHGMISVPRVVPSATPSGHCLFQPSSPWTALDSGLIQTSISHQHDDFVTIRVLAMSRPEVKLRGFVGCVTSAVVSSGLTLDDLVVGIISSPGFSNIITVHRGSVARLPSSAKSMVAEIAGAALGLVIGSLSCGVSALCSSRRGQGGKALLSHGSSVVDPSLKWFLRRLGFELIEAKSDSPADLATLASQVDLVTSGSDSRIEYQAFSGVVTRNGRVFMWNDPRLGLARILQDDPMAIGEALDLVIQRVAGHWPHENIGIRLTDFVLPRAGTLVLSSASLFDSSKAYVLFGGVGGLGIRVALWMYQVSMAGLRSRCH